MTLARFFSMMKAIPRCRLKFIPTKSKTSAGDVGGDELGFLVVDLKPQVTATSVFPTSHLDAGTGTIRPCGRVPC